MLRPRSNRKTLAALWTVIGAGVWPAYAAAHHSFAMYDQAQVKTLTGKLTRYIPGANHAQMIFELLEADGTPMTVRPPRPSATDIPAVIESPAPRWSTVETGGPVTCHAPSRVVSATLA